MTSEPIILMDSPEEGYCESFGWVSVEVSEDEARAALAECCLDEDGEPGMRPVGTAKRVWLRHSRGTLGEEGEYWVKCEAGAEGAREFYEFDATDTERCFGS